MDDIATLLELIDYDRKGDRVIARITVTPWIWEMLLPTAETTPGHIEIYGVPLEIDETHEHIYTLWDVDGNEVYP